MSFQEVHMAEVDSRVHQSAQVPVKILLIPMSKKTHMATTYLNK